MERSGVVAASSPSSAHAAVSRAVRARARMIRALGISASSEPSDLTTHGVIVGMTGSGKTGLGIIFLEEALRSGIPALILDPKGDMTNLLLTFPELAPGDFRPWTDEAAARRDGKTPDEAAAAAAESWASGLAARGR